jgi:hypothetical protein
MGRYIPVFHTELLFVPKFNTGTYQHPFVFFPVSEGISLRFKKYTGTSAFPF